MLWNRDESDVIEAVKRKAKADAPFELAKLGSLDHGGSAGPSPSAPGAPQALSATKRSSKSGWAGSAKAGVLEAVAWGAMEVARWSQDQLANEEEDEEDDDDHGADATSPVSTEEAGQPQPEAQGEPESS